MNNYLSGISQSAYICRDNLTKETYFGEYRISGGKGRFSLYSKTIDSKWIYIVCDFWNTYISPEK
jgi:hypothetical protein